MCVRERRMCVCVREKNMCMCEREECVCVREREERFDVHPTSVDTTRCAVGAGGLLQAWRARGQ